MKNWENFDVFGSLAIVELLTFQSLSNQIKADAEQTEMKYYYSVFGFFFNLCFCLEEPPKMPERDHDKVTY